MPYGDQALFLRRKLFMTTGGFAELPLLEDVVLVRNLKQYGRIVTRSEPVVTSSERWQQDGFLRQTVRNQLILIGFFLGVSCQRLAVWYGLGEKG